MKLFRLLWLSIKKTNRKLMVLMILFGISGSLVMLTQLCMSELDNKKQVVGNSIVIKNAIKYSAIEPELIQEVNQINGVTKVIERRVLPLFLTTKAGNNVIGTYEFLVVPKDSIQTDIQFASVVPIQIGDVVTISFKGKPIDITVMDKDFQEQNLVSDRFVYDKLGAIKSELQIKEIELLIQDNKNINELKDDLIDYGLVLENENENQLNHTLLAQSQLLNNMVVLIKGILMIITIAILLLLLQSKKKSIGILRVLGYSKLIIIFELVLEFLIILLISTVLMMLIVPIEIVIATKMQLIKSNITVGRVVKQYFSILAISWGFGSFINVILTSIALRKNSLELIKHKEGV